MPKRTEKNNLKYCTICKKVYERYWGFHHGSTEQKHDDMPTYGIDREHCKICKEEENARRESNQETVETC